MISSESGEEAMSSEGAEDQMKSVFLLGNPELSIHPSQVGLSHPMAAVPYPYANSYFGGLLTTYAPQALMVGITPTRVPLPLDLANDGPIYVNAKQYHGILRRRQSRAKQEAQNKLIKQRKPYLHESRHLHALKRVRGTGGRFLSKKQLKHQHQHPETTPSSSTVLTSTIHHHVKQDSPELETPHTGFTEYVATTRPNATSTVPDNYHRFPSGAMCSGAMLCCGTQHCTSVVQ